MCYVRNLLQTGHLLTVFSNWPSLYKLLLDIFTLELDTPPQSASQDLKHSAEGYNSTLLYEIMKNNEDELFVTFLEELMSLESSEITNSVKLPNLLGSNTKYSYTYMSIKRVHYKI